MTNILVPPDHCMQPEFAAGRGRYDDTYYPRAWRISAVGYDICFGGLKGVDIKFRDRIDCELAIMGLILLGVKTLNDLKAFDDDQLLRAVTTFLRW